MALLAEQTVPEGSILIVSSGEKESFGLAPTPSESPAENEVDWRALRGRKRAVSIVEQFLQNSAWADIETVVIPGCGSSTLGAAAFGKSVADIYCAGGSEETVAVILAGQGAFDQWMEAASGGMVMAPMANFLNAFDSILEFTAKLNPPLAEMYFNDLLDAIHEAATLYALLRARLIDGAFKRKFPKLNTIVSHSKGNWAVLVALVTFELELPKIERGGKLIDPGRPIDVVTFGNPVDLPDMNPAMKRLFHFHQFVGAVDRLAHNCSVRAWTLHFYGDKKIDPQNPVFDPSANPDEWMVSDAEHHLFPKRDPLTKNELKPYHMPIGRILTQIRQQ